MFRRAHRRRSALKAVCGGDPSGLAFRPDAVLFSSPALSSRTGNVILNAGNLVIVLHIHVLDAGSRRNAILNAVKDFCVTPGFFAPLRMTASQD